ncbi:hypothetical protein [Prevotella koreensis]
MKNLIRIIKPYAGLVAIYTGALLLLLSFIFGWTSSNALLFILLFLVIGGVIVHVAIIKSSDFNE